LPWILGGAFGAAGCWCPHVVSEGNGTASLDAAWQADYDGGGADQFRVTSTYTILTQPLSSAPHECIIVRTYYQVNDSVLEGPLISMDCPLGAGSFQLEDLNAVGCESGCSSLVGTLTVRAFKAPCAKGACGRLDAELSATAVIATQSNDPTVPSHLVALVGQATLYYRESIDQACGYGAE
jgi:hypothetical protein